MAGDLSDTHTDKLTSRETDMESGGQTDRPVPLQCRCWGETGVRDGDSHLLGGVRVERGGSPRSEHSGGSAHTASQD